MSSVSFTEVQNIGNVEVLAKPVLKRTGTPKPKVEKQSQLTLSKEDLKLIAREMKRYEVELKKEEKAAEAKKAEEKERRKFDKLMTKLKGPDHLQFLILTEDKGLVSFLKDTDEDLYNEIFFDLNLVVDEMFKFERKWSEYIKSWSEEKQLEFLKTYQSDAEITTSMDRKEFDKGVEEAYSNYCDREF